MTFLETAKPIPACEFGERRDRLAQVLHKSGIDAFVVEPGYTFQYYANISQADWEPWEPEERPFLMIIEPRMDAHNGSVFAKTSFLSPAFEEGRVRMLGMPVQGDLEIVTWEEHWNPYNTLRDSTFKSSANVSIVTDEEMRDYIVRGLATNGFRTRGLSQEVEAVRQIKSKREVEILRAVNTGTVEAIRAIRPCLVPGLTENEVAKILDETISSIGFVPFFDVVLFDENAALPHGGFETGNKVLKEDTFVLIDVGAHYLGYSSDVTRTFIIPPRKTIICKMWSLLRAQIPLLRSPTSSDPVSKEKLIVWDLVKKAQLESIKMFRPNASAASVDVAARNVIKGAGYGEMKHRVGHGIGIKGEVVPA